MAAEGVASLICTSVALSSPTLDLSRSELVQVPQELYTARHVECLYLEGNKLSSLPDDLFPNLPNLRWLDLRNNRLAKLPPSIGDLRHMKALLLEGNCLTTLPAELGRLTSLTGLNLAGNPLTIPPQNVVQQGTQAVLQYLQTLLNPLSSESSTSLNSMSPNSKTRTKRPDRLKLPTSHSTTHYRNHYRSPSLEQHPGILAFPTPKCVELKPIESQVKPRLSMDSRHQSDSPKKTTRLAKMPLRRKGAVQADQSCGHFDVREIRPSVQGNMVGPRQVARAQEKLEMQETAKQKAKIADEEQQLKNRENLKEWRDETRRLQSKHAHFGGNEFCPPSKTAPFATETQQDTREKDDSSDREMDGVSPMDNKKRAEAAEARQRQLEQRIRDHRLKMQQQRSAVTELLPEEALDKARLDLQIAEDNLRQLRQTNMEYRFTAFTGDTFDALISRRTTHN